MTTIPDLELQARRFLDQTHFRYHKFVSIVIPVPFKGMVKLELQYLDSSNSRHGYGDSKFETTFLEVSLNDLLVEEEISNLALIYI